MPQAIPIAVDAELMEEPRPLKLLPQKAPLSEVGKVVTENYMIYHQTAEQVRRLQSTIRRHNALSE